MRRSLSELGAWVTKVESWWAFAGLVMSTGIFAGVGQQWDALATQGWAAVLIVALACGAAVVIAMSLAYLAISRHRNPKAERLSAEGFARAGFSLEYHPSFNHRRLSENGRQWITVRLKFRTDRTVKDANPYLLCARRYENGAWSDDMLAGMRVLLSWPGSGNRFEPRTIYKNEPVLLFDYNVEESRLSFVTDKNRTPYSLRGCLDDIQPGKYLLQIGVGEGMEMIEDTFILDWFGDFESISLQRASGDVSV